MRNTESPNMNPGQVDIETGENYTNFKTFLKMLIMVLLLIVVSQFIYNLAIMIIKRICNVEELDIKIMVISTIILLIIFVFLERFVIKKPFKAFY